VATFAETENEEPINAVVDRVTKTGESEFQIISLFKTGSIALPAPRRGVRGDLGTVLPEA
jgi:hypothetical protein